MKIKEGYLLRKVADNYVVVPVGDLDFDGMIRLNETGVFIWKALEKETTEEEVISALLGEYNVPEAVARADVAAFIQKLKGAGIIDE